MKMAKETATKNPDITERKQAEEALNESQKCLTNVLDSLDSLVYVVDFNSYEILFINKYGHDTWGDVQGRKCWQAIQKDQKGPCSFCTNDKLVSDTGIPTGVCQWEFQNTVNGRWYECRDQAIPWTGKALVRMEIATDITERKKAEEALVFSNIILRTQQEASIDGILVVDEKGGILSFNQRFVDMWGIPTGVIESKSDDRALQSVMDKLKNPEEFIRKVQHLYANQQETSRDEIALKDDRFFDRYSAPMLGEDGKYYGRVWYFRDITERKRAEEALRQSEVKYKTVFESSKDAIMLLTPEKGFLGGNLACLEMFRCKDEEEFSSKSPADMSPEYQPDGSRSTVKAQQMMAIALGKGSNYFEWIHKRIDGEEFFATVLLTRMDLGNEVVLQATVRDVTERKKADDALRESGEKLRGMFESIGDAVTVTNLEGDITEINQAAVGLWGYAGKEEVIGRKGYEFVAEENRPVAVQDVKEALIERPVKGATEFNFVRKDGSIFSGEARAAMLKDRSGKPVGFISVVRDTTERKQAEEALRASERKYRQLIETLQEGIWAIDQDANTTFVNSCMAKMLGSTVEEMLGKSLFSFMDERGVELAKYHMERRKQGIAEEHGFEFLHKDGRRIYATLETSPLTDEKGNFAGALAGVIDITGRKRAEDDLRKALDDVQRSNKDLEQFAYVASHDLQEPLRMISSYTQLLSKRYTGKLDTNADEFIAYAVDGADRMQKMINDLLTYSRVTTRGKDFLAVDLEKSFSEALDNLKLSIEDNKATITHDPLPKVVADESQMVRLFQNLIGNALKFHGAEPPIIHIGCKDGEFDYTVSIKDNSIGIDNQYFNRLFIIFQRLHTRDQYPGTGIGLAVCKRTVERHGGNIWVESEGAGKGSTFLFTIPKKELIKKTATPEVLQGKDNVIKMEQQ